MHVTCSKHKPLDQDYSYKNVYIITIESPLTGRQTPECQYNQPDNI